MRCCQASVLKSLLLAWGLLVLRQHCDSLYEALLRSYDNVMSSCNPMNAWMWNPHELRWFMWQILMDAVYLRWKRHILSDMFQLQSECGLTWRWLTCCGVCDTSDWLSAVCLAYSRPDTRLPCTKRNKNDGTTENDRNHNIKSKTGMVTKQINQTG